MLVRGSPDTVLLLKRSVQDFIGKGAYMNMGVVGLWLQVFLKQSSGPNHLCNIRA